MAKKDKLAEARKHAERASSTTDCVAGFEALEKAQSAYVEAAADPDADKSQLMETFNAAKESFDKLFGGKGKPSGCVVSKHRKVSEKRYTGSEEKYKLHYEDVREKELTEEERKLEEELDPSTRRFKMLDWD